MQEQRGLQSRLPGSGARGGIALLAGAVDLRLRRECRPTAGKIQRVHPDLINRVTFGTMFENKLCAPFKILFSA